MRDAPYDGQQLTLDEYLATAETRHRYELCFGVVREPPAPTWNHQQIVGELFTRLARHVSRSRRGKVGLSPLDVVLDGPKHLVVQPDLMVVTAEREHIIRDRVWGAPDLVVEVLSPGNGQFDRQQKREWYRQYGVREQWVVDPIARAVEVCDLVRGGSLEFTSDDMIRSRVLPRLRLRVQSLFDEENDGIADARKGRTKSAGRGERTLPR